MTFEKGDIVRYLLHDKTKKRRYRSQQGIVESATTEEVEVWFSNSNAKPALYACKPEELELVGKQQPICLEDRIGDALEGYKTFSPRLQNLWRIKL